MSLKIQSTNIPKLPMIINKFIYIMIEVVIAINHSGNSIKTKMFLERKLKAWMFLLEIFINIFIKISSEKTILILYKLF